MNLFSFFLRNEDATTSVEYAVLLAMILLVTISAISAVGGQTGGLWSGIVCQLQASGFIH